MLTSWEGARPGQEVSGMADQKVKRMNVNVEVSLHDAFKAATAARGELRHLKQAAKALKLPKQIDFRSFRTTHSSLMGRAGARPEVMRDNMGHSDVDVTQNVYGKSWWEERVDAVSAAVDLFMATTDPTKQGGTDCADVQDNHTMLFTQSAQETQLEPQLEPQHQQ